MAKLDIQIEQTPAIDLLDAGWRLEKGYLYHPVTDTQYRSHEELNRALQAQALLERSIILQLQGWMAKAKHCPLTEDDAETLKYLHHINVKNGENEQGMSLNRAEEIQKFWKEPDTADLQKLLADWQGMPNKWEWNIALEPGFEHHQKEIIVHIQKNQAKEEQNAKPSPKAVARKQSYDYTTPFPSAIAHKQDVLEQIIQDLKDHGYTPIGEQFTVKATQHMQELLVQPMMHKSIKGTIQLKAA